MRAKPLAFVCAIVVSAPAWVAGAPSMPRSPSIVIPPAPQTTPAVSQMDGARTRWEISCNIRKDKFDFVLPKAMRANDIDMWIHSIRMGNPDPLEHDLGAEFGTFVFTDRGGDRIERAALGISGRLISENGAYDIVTGGFDLREFVAEQGITRFHDIRGDEGGICHQILPDFGYVRPGEVFGELTAVTELARESYAEAAAPSVVWEELPAVTEPPAANTGFSPARASIVVVSRIPSSKDWINVSFL